MHIKCDIVLCILGFVLITCNFAETMDLRRDEDQENMMENIINEDDVTSQFLNNSGEGDERNRTDGSDEGDKRDERDETSAREDDNSDEGEANGSDGSLTIRKTGEVEIHIN